MQFDDILPHINDYGPYQKRMFYLFVLPTTLLGSFTYFNFVFISAIPDHWCHVPELDRINLPLETKKILSIPLEWRDEILQPSRCEMYDVNYTQLINHYNLSEIYKVNKTTWTRVKCKHGWSYDNSQYRKTLPSQFDAVCSNEWKISVASSLFYVGGFIDNIAFGYIGDRWGRKTAFFLLLILNLIISTITSFSTSYDDYIIYRALIGLTYPALYNIPFVIALEFMAPRKRTLAGNVTWIVYSICMIILTGVAYLLRDWFYLSLASSLPFYLYLLYWWFVPESPRWLLSKGYYDKATAVLKRVAEVNKAEIPDGLLKLLQESAQKQVDNSEKTQISDLLKYPNMRKKIIICCLCWVICAFVYAGLSFGATFIGVNHYLAFAISSFVEIPGVLLSWFITERIGRPWTICLMMGIGGLSCISEAFVPSDRLWTLVILSNIGKACNSAAYNVLYIFTCELFPTVLRSFALSTGALAASVGLITSPYLIMTSTHNKILPVVVMGVASFIGGLLSILLPETLKTNLPQTVQECEDFGKDSKPKNIFFSVLKKRKATISIITDSVERNQAP